MQNIPVPGASDAAPRLTAALRELGRLISLRDPLVNAIETRALTPPQVHTLSWLGFDGHLSMKEIARRLGVTEKTVTGVVDRMERSELVRRTRDTVDRRVVHVELTETGRRQFEELQAVFQKRLADFLALIEHDDGDALVGILERLVRRLAERVPESQTPPPDAP